MFENFTGQSRRVGVAVLITGLALLLGFGAFFSLSSLSAYDVKERIKSRKDELQKLEKRLIYTENLSLTYQKNQFKEGQVITIDKTIDSQRKRIIKNKESVISMSDEIEDLKEEFLAYKHKYKLHVRNSAVGEKISELTLVSGKTYKDVFIKKVDNEVVVIGNQYGSQSFRYDELPSEFRKRFQVLEIKSKVTPNKKVAKNTKTQTKPDIKMLKTKEAELKEKIAALNKDCKKKRAAMAKKELALTELNTKKSRAEEKEREFTEGELAGLNIHNAKKAAKVVRAYIRKINEADLIIEEDKKVIDKSNKEMKAFEKELLKISKQILAISE